MGARQNGGRRDVRHWLGPRAARFDVASAPGTVTIAFAGYDTTVHVRGADGVETRVHAECTTDDRSLTTITVS